MEDKASLDSIPSPHRREIDEQVARHIESNRLLAKIDMHLIPVITILYLMAFLDRVNISNAVLFGLESDLGLSGLQYNNALVIFFVPYVLFEIPANMLMKKMRPHVWLTLCMFGFGVVTVLQGLTFSYSGILTTRFFLGLFEAGMLPGCLYLITMWYRRHEAQKRVTFFFCATSQAGAFGGLLATAIGNLDGARGFRAWRWVFIIEGAATCVIAIVWWFLIPNFPDEASFLTPEEKQAVRLRLQEDVGSANAQQRYNAREVVETLMDYRVFLGGIMYFGMIIPAYGYAYFSPTIIKGLGFSAIQAQLHSVPPYVLTLGLSMIVAFASDRARHRWAFTIATSCLALAGFAMLLAIHDNVHAEYAALFLIVAGVYSTMPVLLCWVNTNLAGHRRRSIGSAWMVGFGNIGGIVASYSFPAKDAPRYTMGYALGVGTVCLSMAAAAVYAVGIRAENRKRDKQGLGQDEKRVEAGGGGSQRSSEDNSQMLGDLSPTYRYMG